MLTIPGLTLVFLGVVVSLGAAFVWVFWEIEQTTSKPASQERRYRLAHDPDEHVSTLLDHALEHPL